jgi:Domain of unknown function (DUF6089)
MHKLRFTEMKKFVPFVLLGCLFAASGHSQSFYAMRRERSVILTGGLGTATYFGDLSNPKRLVSAEPSINVGLQYYLTRRIAVRSELTWFTISGDDKDADEKGRRNRNLSFSSSNLELNAVGIINLYSNGNRFYRRPTFNLYAFGGVGLLYINPKTKYKGEWVALQPLKTEGVDYSLLQPVIPYGIGFRLKVTPLMNFTFEGGWRKTFTDYLDDVSTVYPAIIPFLSDRGQEIGNPAKPGGIRGNPKFEDSYMLVNAKIEYYLPWNVNRRGNGLISTKKRSPYSRYTKKGRLRRR